MLLCVYFSCLKFSAVPDWGRFTIHLKPTYRDPSAKPSQIKVWQLNNPELTSDEETIKLYLALSSLLSPVKRRVTAELLKSWKAEAFSSTAWNQRVWVLPRFRQPLLENVTWTNQELGKPEKMKDYILDAAALSDLPAGLHPSDHWFVDTCVPKGVLGPGASEITVSVGSRRRVTLGAGGLAALPGPSAPSTADNAVEKDAPRQAGGASPDQAPSRVLRNVPSDPDKQSWREVIGRRTVQLVSEGKWVSILPGCTHNVKYWFGQ